MFIELIDAYTGRKDVIQGTTSVNPDKILFMKERPAGYDDRYPNGYTEMFLEGDITLHFDDSIETICEIIDDVLQKEEVDRLGRRQMALKYVKAVNEERKETE